MNGAKLAYEVDGRGSAIVLIHAGVADMSMWDEPFRALAKRHRVLRYDMRGYGASKTEAVTFSNRQDLLALMDHLKIDKAILVGNSRGGIIALDFALENPSRVSGLVSVAGSVSGYEAEPTAEEKAVFGKIDPLWEKKDFEAISKLEADIWVNGPAQKTDRAPRAIWERVHGMILHNYRTHTAEAKAIPLIRWRWAGWASCASRSWRWWATWISLPRAPRWRCWPRRRRTVAWSATRTPRTSSASNGQRSSCGR